MPQEGHKVDLRQAVVGATARLVLSISLLVGLTQRITISATVVAEIARVRAQSAGEPNRPLHRHHDSLEEAAIVGPRSSNEQTISIRRL